MANRHRLEGHQKLREHQLGRLPKVEAELELGKIFGKMLRADMNMRAANAEFQSGPEIFRRVDVGIAARPFLGRMPHRLKRLASLIIVRARAQEGE